MFTIKHIDPHGNEFGLEATSYFVEHDRDNDIVRLFTYDTQHRSFDNSEYTGLWAGVSARSSNCNGIEKHTVYVMNRFGATVSTLHYVDVVARDDCKKASVDPEKFAAARVA